MWDLDRKKKRWRSMEVVGSNSGTHSVLQDKVEAFSL
jgi:hypothetical protein